MSPPKLFESIVGSKPEKRARHEAQADRAFAKPRPDSKRAKHPPGNLKGSTQTSSRPLKLYSDVVKSNKVLSKPLGDKEIHQYNSNGRLLSTEAFGSFSSPKSCRATESFLNLLGTRMSPQIHS